MKVEANKEYHFDDEQYLFKYFDLHKLIYFLYEEKLFFSPLSYFDDPLEGISGKLILEEHEKEKNNDRENGKQHGEKKEQYRDYLEKVQQNLFASCWFLRAIGLQIPCFHALQRPRMASEEQCLVHKIEGPFQSQRNYSY